MAPTPTEEAPTEDLTVPADSEAVEG